MTGTVSTILVMGPRGAGKSDFIKKLDGQKPFQTNGVPTDNLRAISVSLYFEEGKTIKLVKFPGFDESGTDPTDAKLFVDIATFLGVSRRRGELIQSIIYLHPITGDGLNAADVDRNVKMLQEIANDVMQNVVLVTTKWGSIPDSDRHLMEQDLRNHSMQFYGDPFMRHDGTKWSALNILNIAKKKIPELLDLGENPALTIAGIALSDHIEALIDSKQHEERGLGRELAIAKRAHDRDKVKQLDVALKQLGAALTRLKNEEDKLEADVDWVQGDRDNKALEVAIKERHDLAMKDWKAAYDKLVIENKALKDKVDEQVAGSKALQTEVENLRKTISNPPRYTHSALTIPIRATRSYEGSDPNTWPELIPYSEGEVLYTNGREFMAEWGAPLYLVRNNARRVGGDLWFTISTI